MTVPERVRKEVQRILDREARRMLDEKLAREMETPNPIKGEGPCKNSEPPEGGSPQQGDA